MVSSPTLQHVTGGILPSLFGLRLVICCPKHIPQPSLAGHECRSDFLAYLSAALRMSPPGSPPLVFPAEDEELPGYTPTREPHEHVNSLFNRNNQPWMTLKLLSEAPRGSKFPVYFNGGTVRGLAHITLERPQTIRSVVIEVRSKLALATADELPLIWHERKVLWEAGENSHPQTVSSAGSWKWGFSFPIPTHFDDSPNGGSASTPLPGSLDLKPYPAFVEYRVLLFVKRGKWFPALSEVHTLFAYVIRERAPPPSPLREFAYSQGHAPPNPSGDPDGWESSKELTVKGTLFGNREVVLTYQTHVNKPVSFRVPTQSDSLTALQLVYSRGGTVFYRIKTSSNDPQALQLLSAPSAIAVLLTREVRSVPLRKSAQASLGTKGADLDVKVMARGVSWVDSRLPIESSDTRILEGEIAIPHKISPDVEMAAFRLHYSVTFAINTVGFIPHNESEAVQKHSVRLVSHPALGPVPISRIPPEYDQATGRSSDNDLEWALSAVASGSTAHSV